MRRTGLLSALLLTAALLCAMPGLLRFLGEADDNRMNPTLRPQKSRTLTVWLLGGGMGDQNLLSALCSAFEKQQKGVRVFLRGADAAELDSPEAVLPDGILYTTGDVSTPEKTFLPLSGLGGLPEGVLFSGKSNGVQYAAPLWFSPNVLSLPAHWLTEKSAPTPDSFFGLAAAAPDGEAQALSPETLPWRRLLQENGLWVQDGVCLPQTLFVCPQSLRSELIAAVRPASTPGKETARAWTLREHGLAVKAGDALVALPLSPPVSGEARYFSLLRDSEDARALLYFLTGEEAGQAAQNALYLAALPGLSPTDAVQAAAQRAFADGCLIVNAFAHAKGELAALCLDGFRRGADPVETLLRLR